ncbi:MAG: glycosyl transferase family 2 [Deltaproteobacteria bacterium]|nr:glycosyl transferase family 2 [Deltaproteobacteria bacterium]
MLRVSIITIVRNNRATMEDCVKNVLSQSYKEIEYIVVDGGSNDGTIDIIQAYHERISQWISEPDQGIYDAMNKGIEMATGQVIGFLHSSDVYAHPRVIEEVARVFEKSNASSVYGDLQYVDKENLNKVIRNWKSSPYRHGKFRQGWMPPHPTFFVRKEIYEKYGYFNTDFRIAGDYELMLRFLERYRISAAYIPEVLVKMRWGGMSNGGIKNILIKSYEDYRAWGMNDLNGGVHTILFKNLSKIPQFLEKA